MPKSRMYPTPQSVIDYYNQCERDNCPVDAWTVWGIELREAFRIINKEHQEAIEIDFQKNIAQI